MRDPGGWVRAQQPWGSRRSGCGYACVRVFEIRDPGCAWSAGATAVWRAFPRKGECEGATRARAGECASGGRARASSRCLGGGLTGLCTVSVPACAGRACQARERAKAGARGVVSKRGSRRAAAEARVDKAGGGGERGRARPSGRPRSHGRGKEGGSARGREEDGGVKAAERRGAGAERAAAAAAAAEAAARVGAARARRRDPAAPRSPPRSPPRSLPGAVEGRGAAPRRSQGAVSTPRWTARGRTLKPSS